MKTKLSLLFMSICGVLSLAGCKGSDSAPPPVAAGACVAPNVMTGSGCLPQGSCPVGFGTLNNQCIPGNGGVGVGFNSCPAGQAPTSIGCGTPNVNGCQAGMAWVNNQCLPVINGGIGQIGQPVGQACQAGQVYTQFGCMPQGNCPGGQGFYNNQCVPAIQPPIGGGLPGGGMQGYPYGGGSYGLPYGGYGNYAAPYGMPTYGMPYGGSSFGGSYMYMYGFVM